MSNLENFLSRLQKVRKNGKDYIACCPAHDDRSPSLAIREVEDGRILIKCFAGCSADDVMGAVGMELKDLMPENVGFQRKRPDPRPFNPYDVLAAMINDATVILVLAKDMQKGRVIDESESLLLAKLIGRLTMAVSLAGGRG